MYATSTAPGTSRASRPASSTRTALPWLLLGGVLAALLELGFAVAWWAPQGVSPTRVAQGVAAWWIGDGAFTGGPAAALLGLAIYCHMMFAVVALYYAASLRQRFLLRYPWACGALYGAAMYVLILECAVPLFAVHPAGSPDPTWRLACLVAYMLLVGGTSAWAARRAQGLEGTGLQRQAE